MTLRALVLAGLVLTGCERDPLPVEPVDVRARCDPAALGLRATRSGLDWLESAVDGANALLAEEGEFELRLVTDTVPVPDDAVPVWPVAAFGLAPLQTAFVPTDCQAIFIQTAALGLRVEAWNGDESTGLTIERAPIATWILLHETGHIRDARTGQFEPAAAVRGTNFSDTEQKRHELSADAYAARLIRTADASRPFPTFIASMNARQALSQLSWNLQRDRQLSLSGSSVLATPAAFGDVGYSHPNLELRVLISQVLIDDTDEAGALLDDFVETRDRATDKTPRLLFDANQH